MKLVHVVVIFASAALAQCQENNVCRTIEDYYTIKTNPNCSYNYAVHATVPEIIKRSGRPFAEYKAITNDGYVLTIFRIPNWQSPNKKRSPVLLQHGLITTSANWISLLDDSLAFQLHDQGYDVWLGNYRGTQYSEGHTKYTVNDEKYWDYSVDDVALKDLPAMLKLISEETKSYGNILYIGHSLGSTFPLMYASEFPDRARQLLKLIVLTAPAYTLHNMVSPLRLAAPFMNPLERSAKTLGFTNLLSQERTTKGLLSTICLDSPIIMQQCFESTLLAYGPQTGITPDKYPMFFDQHPSGSALKLIKQLSDFVHSPFRKFDYGVNNIKVYGSILPPVYDISKIIVPTLVIYAKNDWLTAKKDSLLLYNSLSKKYRFGLYEIPDENFNHIDFMFGNRAKELYVDYVIKLFNSLPKT